MVLCSHMVRLQQWIFKAVCLPAETGDGNVCRVVVRRNGVSCALWFMWKQKRTYASMRASSISRHIQIAYFIAEEVESIKVVDLLTCVLFRVCEKSEDWWVRIS